jgi:hypothetical protein
MIKINITLFTFFLALSSASTQATVIVSTHSDGPKNTYYLTPDIELPFVGPGFNDYAAGFIWNSNATFDFVSLYLSKVGIPLSLKVSIFDDLNNAPGSEYLTLTASREIDGPDYYRFTGAFELVENEQYWIVASTGGYLNLENQYIWWQGRETSNNYINTVWRRFEDRANKYEQWSSSRVSPAMFTVHATIPEPSTLAIVALGLMSLGFRRFNKYS